MARIFAYIVHKDGVADDSAAELAAAAQKDRCHCVADRRLSPVGARISIPSCNALRASYAEVWKIANEALAYPNAELVRKALVERPAGRQQSCWFRTSISESICRRACPSR